MTSESLELPSIERQVLEYWKNDATFHASVDQSGDAGEYVFYDGPPFANGLPHFGHLLTGYVKDVIPRYQTMQGKRVRRQFGWDCHGLPAELEAEKQLDLGSRQEIAEYGIAEFNDYCRSSVLRYTREWEEYVTRQARWVEFDNAYKTMDRPYMESVLWAFKELYDKGLIYEGHRVLPYCWSCETPLSNFETRADDATRPREDPTVTVAFELVPEEGSAESTCLLAWTTTPWTLPSNLALAVGSDIEYSVFQRGGKRYVLASERVEQYQSELEGWDLVGTLQGRDLVGKRYKPLFSYFADHEGAFRVLESSIVTTDEGTGVVHLAPGFGEDDQTICAAVGISLVCPVDDLGRFTSAVPDYEGVQVFEANTSITNELRATGSLVKQEAIEHLYPHCWRSDHPLIYKAVDSWFVRVTAIKDRMVELNQDMNWVPVHIKDGAFGKWLENARDWSISRSRFWGAPIPVWKSDDPRYPRIDVYGSYEELARDFGLEPTDLHRPVIDDLVRPNPDDPTGTSTMRRVEDVLDCWFESGAMPFAQMHYPFENKELFEANHPADFIVEYPPQVRGWFYTLHVLSTALFDRPAFKNCIVHGVLLGDDGRKMSKRLRNYPDPEAMFTKYGADAVRFYLMSSPAMRGGEIPTSEKGIAEASRRVAMPLWNAWRFLQSYSTLNGIIGYESYESENALDQYILARTEQLRDRVQANLDNYLVADACDDVVQYIDALNNWYIRRSRERFWGTGQQADTEAAVNTLHTALLNVNKIAAPLLPMLTEFIYREQTGERSVHLARWPEFRMSREANQTLQAMEQIREIASVGLALRSANRLRTRLPLRSLTIVTESADELRPYSWLLASELNVKQVVFRPTAPSGISQALKIAPAVLGPRAGALAQQIIADARVGNYRIDPNGDVVVCGRVLEADEFRLVYESVEDADVRSVNGSTLVILDTVVTPELEAEGAARDFIRAIQQQRKALQLEMTDRIRVRAQVPSHVREQLMSFIDYIRSETLSTDIVLTDQPAEAGRASTAQAWLEIDRDHSRMDMSR